MTDSSSRLVLDLNRSRHIMAAQVRRTTKIVDRCGYTNGIEDNNPGSRHVEFPSGSVGRLRAPSGERKRRNDQIGPAQEEVLHIHKAASLAGSYEPSRTQGCHLLTR